MVDISLSVRLRYYKQKAVQKAIVACAKNKEIAVKFGNHGFGKRPDVLINAQDVMEFVKQGATSFHCSEEIWHNPMQIVTGSKRKELDQLRKGWDLVLDIDCKELEYSKLAADLLVKALEYHGIKSVSVKFSGNHGFHLAVPFKSFPKTIHGIPTKNWFPEGPRHVALYLQEMIRPHLAKRMLAMDDIAGIIKKSGKPKEDLVKNGMFDPFGALDIDTVLIASRHLYRMPYSFNEKSGLVSIPITHNQILTFKKADAVWDKVKPNLLFLEESDFVPNEGTQLLIQSFDKGAEIKQAKIETDARMKKHKTATNSSSYIPLHAISETLFPPCIKNILDGIVDGKKRSVFLLLNFLRSVAWDYDKIEELLLKWNENNAKKSEELRETVLLGQLRYHKVNNKQVLPANCDNPAYFKSFGVCTPDGLCKKIKNPVLYATLKAKILNSNEEYNKKKNKNKKSKANANSNAKDKTNSSKDNKPKKKIIEALEDNVTIVGRRIEDNNKYAVVENNNNNNNNNNKTKNKQKDNNNNNKIENKQKEKNNNKTKNKQKDNNNNKTKNKQKEKNDNKIKNKQKDNNTNSQSNKKEVKNKDEKSE